MNVPRRNADFPVGESRRLENRRYDLDRFMAPTLQLFGWWDSPYDKAVAQA